MTENQLVVQDEGSSTDQEDRVLAVHPQVDPRLSLPEHLQTVAFDEDVWRRMAGSNLRHPSLTIRALREDANMRDLLRSAVAAASEREKEVLMHNQARFFSSLLWAVAKNVGNFLNTPMVPATLRQASRKAEEGATPDASGKLKTWLLFLLTPKVLLSVIALGFGVLAGYSQIQVRNLNSTIDTYEKALASLDANNEALGSRIEGFDSIVEGKVDEVNRKIEELRTIELENAKLRSEAEGLNSKVDQLDGTVGDLQAQLKSARAGKEASVQELDAKLATRSGELATAKEESARIAGELSQVKEALKAQEAARGSIAGERNGLYSQTIDLKTELAKLDTKLAEARQDGALLIFAERALEEIRNLARRYSTIKDDHIMTHVRRFDAQKKRHDS